MVHCYGSLSKLIYHLTEPPIISSTSLVCLNATTEKINIPPTQKNNKNPQFSFNSNTFNSPWTGFPGSSADKESACNAADPGSIPGLGRFLGEGIGYPLQYSWASLVAQLVKNLPTVRETWVRPLGWEDLLEKGTATHSNILAWRIPWTVHGVRKESDKTAIFTFTILLGRTTQPLSSS